MAAPWPMHYKVDVSSANSQCHWVSSDAQLQDAVAAWDDVLALDTEFIRTNTFFPLPGLYQVASAGQVYLIDPLAIEDWTPFVDVLSRSDVVKIMHACQEDLELLHHHLGVVLSGLFDTQFAHAFVSDQFSLSYARLVEARLGVSLDKHETRSDWLARPLSDKQIAYAVEDVVHLEALYDGLREDLESAGKIAWCMEEMSARASYKVPEPRQYFKNMKKAWHLAPQQLAVLQELCAWREAKAVSENVPRNRVVWDEHLLQFAQVEQLDMGEISASMPRGIAHKYGPELIMSHVSGTQQTLLPQPLARPLTSSQGAIVKRLKEAGAEVARELSLAPELLCRKRELEDCVRHFLAHQTLSPTFLSWRKPLVGGRYLSLILEMTGQRQSGSE